MDTRFLSQGKKIAFTYCLALQQTNLSGLGFIDYFFASDVLVVLVSTGIASNHKHCIYIGMYMYMHDMCMYVCMHI